jgi:hypothetical protein
MAGCHAHLSAMVGTGYLFPFSLTSGEHTAADVKGLMAWPLMCGRDAMDTGLWIGTYVQERLRLCLGYSSA